MDAPTAVEVREWTKLSELKNADDPDAERVVAQANSTLKRITGLTFASVDAEDEPIVEQAVRGLAESMWFDQSEEMLETLSDFALIQSFSAGPYSETRRSAEDAMKAKALHPWPWLSSLLWGLLTEDKYDYWWAFFGGDPAPASAVTEVDWSGGGDGAYGGVSQLDPWEQ